MRNTIEDLNSPMVLAGVGSPVVLFGAECGGISSQLISTKYTVKKRVSVKISLRNERRPK